MFVGFIFFAALNNFIREMANKLVDDFHTFIYISNLDAGSVRNTDLVLACEEDWCN